MARDANVHNRQQLLEQILVDLGFIGTAELDSVREGSQGGVPLWEDLRNRGYVDKPVCDTLQMASKGYIPIDAARATLSHYRVKEAARTQSRTPVPPPAAARVSREGVPLLRAVPPPPPTPVAAATPAAAQTPAATPPAIPSSSATIRAESPHTVYQSLVGRDLGKYRVVSVLGRGASGTVFLCQHNLLNIPVAVKVLDPHLAESNPDMVRRFQFEARTAARISHPNLIRVLDCDLIAGLNLIVMDYVDGVTVSELLKIGGPMAEQRALQLGYAVASALAAALKEGIIHRDVKPSNVILTKGQQTKLADLGLAKVIDHVTEDTRPGVGLGTPFYFSPEQSQDAAAVDHRSDIYSLGITLYQMLTGQLPYTGATLAEIVYQHRYGKAKPISEIVPSVTRQTESLVAKMMAKDPADRFQSYDELLLATAEAIAQSAERPAAVTADAGPSSTSLVRKLWDSIRPF